MNWDISIGLLKQIYGWFLQVIGQRLSRRKTVLNGEALEYAGRLQVRYGTLKHQVQWNVGNLRFRREPIVIRDAQVLRPSKKPISL
jgi:hypothetical protein